MPDIVFAIKEEKMPKFIGLEPGGDRYIPSTGLCFQLLGPNIPKGMKEGDKAFIVFKGKIRGYLMYDHMDVVVRPRRVYFRAKTWTELEPPLIPCMHFMGIIRLDHIHNTKVIANATKIEERRRAKLE